MTYSEAGSSSSGLFRVTGFVGLVFFDLLLLFTCVFKFVFFGGLVGDNGGGDGGGVISSVRFELVLFLLLLTLSDFKFTDCKLDDLDFRNKDFCGENTGTDALRKETISCVSERLRQLSIICVARF